MKYQEFLDLAKKLKDDFSSKEVEYRTAISRAFNYSFLLIRNRHKNDKRIEFYNGDQDKRAVGELLKLAKKGVETSKRFDWEVILKKIDGVYSRAVGM